MNVSFHPNALLPMFSRMNTNTIFYLIPSVFFAVCILLLNPVVASADSLGNFVTCQGSYTDPCSICHLLEMLNRIMRFVLVTMVSVFFILVAFAGFRLATGVGNPDVTKLIGTVLRNGVIGFVIMLSAWLIVDTILKIMMDESESIGMWNEVLCESQPPVTPADRQLFGSDVMVTSEEMLPDGGVRVYPEGSPDDPVDCAPMTMQDGGGNSVEVQPCSAGDSQRETVDLFGHSVTVHQCAAPSLRRINQRWEDAGGNDLYQVNVAGGYACRSTVSGSRCSNHSYGLAVDFNPEQNPYGDEYITDMPDEFVNLFRDEGWGWGGDWNSVSDAMHFSKAGGSQGGNEGGDMVCD